LRRPVRNKFEQRRGAREPRRVVRPGTKP
jgi:hypothetical protein